MAAVGNGVGNGGTSNANLVVDEQIIRLVRRQPCLYDPRQQDYKDADRKAAVWRDIATNVGMPANECEHRWRYLRDRYTRERKRKSQQPSSNGSSNWALASQMSFIQEFIKHRSFKVVEPTLNDKQIESQQRPNLRVKIKTESGANNNHTSSDETDGGQASPAASFDQHSSTAAECYPIAASDPIMEALRDRQEDEESPEENDQRQDRSASDQRSSYNEDQLFCLSVAQTLRRLPLMRRSMAKVQILQLIHEIEFGHS